MLGNAAPPPPPRNLDWLAIVGLGICWGLNWPAVRIGLNELPPWALRTIGMGTGAMILMMLAMVRGRRLWPARHEWLPVLGAGLLTMACFNVLLAFAQLLAPTGRAAIVTFTLPAWTILFARIFLGERLDGRRWAGLVLGFAGLASLGLPLIRAGQFPPGLWLAMLAGMSWAMGTIVTKRWPVRLPPVSMAAWQLVAGTFFAGLGALAFEWQSLAHEVPWAHLHPSTWIAVAYYVVFSQALAYIVWYGMLGRLPAGTMSLSLLLVPAVGVLGSVLFLGEHPTAADYLGLVLIMIAAAVVNLPLGARHWLRH